MIFCFSGTGNSLAVAKDLSTKLDSELRWIPSLTGDRRIEIAGELVGLVFPVYHQGIPSIVERFVNKLDDLDAKYVFGVCTCGDSPGITFEYLSRLVESRGGTLAAGFAVKMPYNYVTPSRLFKGFYNSFVLGETSTERRQELLSGARVKVESIARYVCSGRRGNPETSARIIERLVDLLNLRETLQKSVRLKVCGFQGRTDLPFRESLRLMDHGFWSDEKCTGCGTCAKICPVGNIKLRDGRPAWHHRCEQCFGCLHWCPNGALQFQEGTTHGQRYHHPEISLAEMILRRNGSSASANCLDPI